MIMHSLYLKEALNLNKDMLTRFASESGGLYLTAHDAEALLVRPMEAWDGALPSGNAVAASNMLRLARMSSSSELEVAADKIFKAFSALLMQAPVGVIHMLSAQVYAGADGIEVVLAGDKNSQQAKVIVEALNQRYLPYAVVLWRDEESIKLIPFIKLQTPINNQVTAYVCKNFQCNQPVTDSQEMLDLLQEKANSGDIIHNLAYP